MGEDPDLNAANTKALRELQGSRSFDRSSLSGPCNSISERQNSVPKGAKMVNCMQNASNTVLSGPSNSLRTNTAVRSVVDKPPAVPLRSSLKQTKMTRFSDSPTVHRIPARSRARRSKHTDGGMYDLSYEAEITIEPSSEEPSAQDQDIVQKIAETESQFGAIDTEDTLGEPLSDKVAASQVDKVPPFPMLTTVNGLSEPSSLPAEVTSPPRIPSAAGGRK